MASVHQFESDPTLSVTTLGAAFIVAGKDRGAGARTLGPGKPLALLTYLAFSPGRAATRDALVDLLWADVERDDGRHALRQTIWYIRKHLGERSAVATRDVVRVGAPVISDRDEFLAAIDGQRFEDAISLYRGEFFPDFAQPGALEFEHWADLERQRLRSAFLRAGHAVVRSWLSIARHKDAVKLARRLRDTEKSEANWRLVLECLIAGRDQLGAALEADALEQFIASEEREAEPATRSLLRVVRQTPQASQSTATSGLVAALIGREQEFAALVAAWDRARQRESQHIHVTAGAGIGKTRLLADFGARLRSQRAHIASIGARPGERLLPYSLASEVAGALAQLSGAAGVGEGAAASLVALNPSLSTIYRADADSSHGDEALRKRTLALRELIAAIADERPLAIVIDDWHWADAASQQLIGSAIHRLAGERVLVVTAGRPGYASPEGPHTKRVMLAPLTEPEVGEVIASLGELPDEAWSEQLAKAVHAASDGSPLLVLETIQWLLDRGVASIDGERWTLRDLGALHGVSQSGSAIRQRLAPLDAEDRAIVTAMAVAGVPLSGAVLGPASHLNEVELVRRVEQLEQRGFVARSGDAWHVAHDLIAESTLETLTPEQRREAERRVGEAELRAAPREQGVVLQAGQHFLRASEAARAKSAFVQWTHLRREDGDSQSIRNLAAEFAGTDAAPREVEELLRGVPLNARYSRGQRQAALVVAGLVAIAATLVVMRPAPPAPPPPEVELVASFERSPGDTAMVALRYRVDDLARLDVIDVGSMPDTSIHIPFERHYAELSPDQRFWATSRVFEDTGGIELVAIDSKTGSLRRLTSRQGDDEQPTWSPTANVLAFSTGGFNPSAWNDIAALDIASGEVRQLTSGDETDANPIYSPRGDRIAFARRYWNDRADVDFCLINSDGSGLNCRPLSALEGSSIAGWYDADNVVARFQSRPTEPGGLGIIDVNTLHVQRIYDGDALAARLSLDGRFVVCLCTSNPRVPHRWKLLSIDDKRVDVDIVRGIVSNLPIDLWWVGPKRPPIYQTRIEVRSLSDTIPIGFPYQVEAYGADASGQVTPLRVAQWHSSDVRIATIDSTGLIRPRTRGAVRIDAKSPDGLTGSKTFIVGDLRPVLLTSLEWRSAEDSAVMLFGKPRPLVVNEPGFGPALLTNGDSSFTSGFMSSHSYDGRRGLVLEARVSAPITMKHWQSIGVGLITGFDSLQFVSWDRSTGEIAGTQRITACEMGYPGRPGPQGKDFIGWMGRDAPAPVEASSGRPFDVLVQLFPDGRCGVAVNGIPMGTTATPPAASSRYWLAIHGYSTRTKILVGRVRVWSGVSPTIPWPLSTP
jgi:DNA-binding SARP family transcriptional activator